MLDCSCCVGRSHRSLAVCESLWLLIVAEWQMRASQKAAAVVWVGLASSLAVCGSL